MSCARESLLTKVTLVPTATVSVFGETAPLALIVIVASDGAGDGLGAGAGAGAGAGPGAGVGAGAGEGDAGDEEPPPHMETERAAVRVSAAHQRERTDIRITFLSPEPRRVAIRWSVETVL